MKRTSFKYKRKIEVPGMKKSKAENLGVKASFGLKQKILFPAIGLLVLTVCIILALVLPLSSQKAMELSSDLMVSMSKQYANDVQGKLNAAWNSAKALSPVFSQFGRNTSRTTDTNLLEIVLEQNDDLFGTFTIWEPDAYDGIDSLYVNSKYSDETGRFIPYVHHGDGDEVVIEPMPDYETEGAGDYYLVPKNTMEETVVDPFYSDVGGRQVMISSMVVPLIRSNEFVGVVGMDILDGYSDVDLPLRISKRYECREANAAFYRPLFGIYESLYPAVKGSFQQLAAARGH
jgi:methyl-accepting chemotaxis protein